MTDFTALNLTQADGTELGALIERELERRAGKRIGFVLIIQPAQSDRPFSERMTITNSPPEFGMPMLMDALNQWRNN